MPYKTSWVNPKLFLSYKGVKIYHLYKDDDIDFPSIYNFTTNKKANYGDGEFCYDVRTLDVDHRLEKERPIYMSDRLDDGSPNKKWINASLEQREAIRLHWNLWHNKTEQEVIRSIIHEAIENGKIVSPHD